MSVVTPKIGYARKISSHPSSNYYHLGIRNCQRKSNRSTYDLKDITTDAQNNDSSQHSESQGSIAIDFSAKHPGGLKKCASVRDNNDFTELFGHNFSSGNLDYVNSLISNNNKSGCANKIRDHSSRKKVGHQRAKSTMIEPAKKPQISTEKDNGSPDPAASVNSGQNILSLQNASATTQASSLKPDTEYDSGMYQSELEKDEILKMKIEHRDPNNTPAEKQGKLFDHYFRKESKRGNVMRKSMSLEDLRFEKNKETGEEEQSIAQSSAGIIYLLGLNMTIFDRIWINGREKLGQIPAPER